ncbi:hypothetical protein ABZP36_032366 [Zizania latifolia]
MVGLVASSAVSPHVFFSVEPAAGAVDGMDAQTQWRAGASASRLSYKNATIAVFAINLLATALLLRNHFSSWPRFAGGHRFDSAQLQYIWESEELRRAMEPVDLIRRVKEIEQEAYSEHGMTTQEDAKQTAAVDLSKRLKDLRAGNDGSSQKALEEWRKRKMERARQRAIGKNGTASDTSPHPHRPQPISLSSSPVVWWSPPRRPCVAASAAHTNLVHAEKPRGRPAPREAISVQSKLQAPSASSRVKGVFHHKTQAK